MNKKTLEIIDKNQLVSVMSRTKWLKLGDVIESFGSLEPAVHYKTFAEGSSFGYATIHWDQFAVMSEQVLWLDIQTYKAQYVGALVEDKKIDIKSDLLSRLDKASIPHSFNKDDIRVWGYLSPGQNVNFL